MAIYQHCCDSAVGNHSVLNYSHIAWLWVWYCVYNSSTARVCKLHKKQQRSVFKNPLLYRTTTFHHGFSVQASVLELVTKEHFQLLHWRLIVLYTGTSQKIRIWWKSSFFLVTYFKKWNSYFRFITCKVKHFKSFCVLILMIRTYSSWKSKISISKY